MTEPQQFVLVLQNAQISKWKPPWPRSIPAVTLLMYSYISSEAGARSNPVSPDNYLTNSAGKKAWEGHSSKPQVRFSPLCVESCPTFAESCPGSPGDKPGWTCSSGWHPLGVSWGTDIAGGGGASALSWRCWVLLSTVLPVFPHCWFP